MEKEELYLGFDIGTSTIKSILINDDCRVLRQTSERYKLDNPHDGWLEIDPESWIEAFITVAERLLDGVDRNSIKRIGVTGQMHTLVLLDEDGKPLRPAIMWNDLRTKELIPKIKDDIRSYVDGEYLSRIISTGSPLANIIWVKLKEPEIFKKIRTFQIGWDYVVYRLTGKHCTDYCNASTSSMYSLSEECWSEEIRNYLGLDVACYPDVNGSVDVAGTITEEFQRKLSLPDGVEVITGTGDNPATVISTGGYWSRYPVLSLGTSGVITRIFAGEQANCYGKKILFAFHKGKCSVLEQGAIQSCGSTYDWWNKQLGNLDDLKKFEEEIDIREEIKNCVLFYPHLAGDKTLYSDPELRGMFVGFDINSDKKTLHYSVLEGICFSIRELIEKMNIFSGGESFLRVVGGASDNKLWMQILSNVLKVRVEKLNGTSGAVYGIAFLAAKANKTEELCKVTQKDAEIMMTYLPDKGIQSEYDKKYDCFLRMRTAIRYIYGIDELQEWTSVKSEI